MYVYVYILGNMHKLLKKLLYLITGCLQDVYYKWLKSEESCIDVWVDVAHSIFV